MPTLAETKDIVTIGAALLSPFIGAGTAIWVYRRKEREIIDGFIIWTERMTFSGPEEMPTLVIQNRSEKKVAIRRVIFSKKRRVRRNGPGTSLYYEDPSDLSFPYEIDPGSTRSLNRDQVRDGAAVMGWLLPIFIDIMMDHPEHEWGMPHYPVVD